MKETQKKSKEKQLLDHDTVSRSNVLIESKSSTSLFERKLLNIAIAKAYVEDGDLQPLPACTRSTGKGR